MDLKRGKRDIHLAHAPTSQLRGIVLLRKSGSGNLSSVRRISHRSVVVDRLDVRWLPAARLAVCRAVELDGRAGATDP